MGLAWCCNLVGLTRVVFVILLHSNEMTIPANRLYGAATSRPILQPCLRCVLCISIVADDSVSCAHAPADGLLSDSIVGLLVYVVFTTVTFGYLYIQYLSLIYLCYCSNVLVLKVLANV